MTQQVYFNKKLKYLVINLTVSQAELAKLLGVTRQVIHNLLINDSDVNYLLYLK